MSEEHPEQHKKENHKTSKTYAVDKITLWKIISSILGILLIVSIFTSGFGFKSGVEVGNDAQPAQPRQAEPSQDQPTQEDKVQIDVKSLIDDDAIKGDEDAPVTIVEWSDYQCPFCARFYSQTFGQIDSEYIQTGKVRFIYRDFPLSFHPYAQKAAEAAECAGEQGKYYEMHNKLFEEGVSGGVDSFKQYAKDIGLDSVKFNNCLDSGQMASEIANDMQVGQQVGVTGTPGFLINGKLVVGAQPFEVFKSAIDAELAK